MESGWIKLHRKTIECGFFNNPNLSHFWVWCLLKASHKHISFSINYQVVDLMPGQFVIGRKNASFETGLSEQTIRTCLRNLEKLGNIIQKSTNKFTVVTICKWETYQNSEYTINQQTTSNQPAGNQQVTTNNNDNNDKNDKKKSVGGQKGMTALTDLPVHFVKELEARGLADKW